MHESGGSLGWGASVISNYGGGQYVGGGSGDELRGIGRSGARLCEGLPV